MTNVMIVLNIGLMAMSGSVIVFGLEKSVYKREMASGINILSYFLSKITVELASSIYRPTLFLLLFHTFTLPYARYSHALINLFFVDLVGSGMGFLVSTFLGLNTSQFAGVVLVMGSALLSGVSPTLPSLNPFGRFLAKFFSFARWGVEGMYLAELRGYEPHFATGTVPGSPPIETPPNYWRPAIDRVMESLDYKWSDYPGVCLGALICQAVGSRLLAFLLLRFGDRVNRLVNSCRRYLGHSSSGPARHKFRHLTTRYQH